MTDLIIKGAGGIKDGLYVIKDGELFKYKPNRGTVYTVRSYHIRPISQRSMYQLGYIQGREDEFKDRPKDTWAFDKKGYFYCPCCGEKPRDQVATTDFCPNCGADMRGEDE